MHACLSDFICLTFDKLDKSPENINKFQNFIDFLLRIKNYTRVDYAWLTGNIFTLYHALFSLMIPV